MQADAPPWETLVFDEIDDVDAVKVTVAFGPVDIVARGRGTGATCPDPCVGHGDASVGVLGVLPLVEYRVELGQSAGFRGE